MRDRSKISNHAVDMNLYCLGINHRTAPIEIREKVWFSAEEIKSTLRAFRERYVKECFLISTCNRTELYYVPQQQSVNGDPLWKILSSYNQADKLITQENFYTISSLHAVKHIFSVASGLDSMVLGDVQILNQIKEAFSLAQEVGTVDMLLTRLLQSTLHVGKLARTETEISEGAISISYAAAELASKIYEDISKRAALLIGAGETGKLAAKHLVAKNLGKLLIANRTRTRAETIATELGASVIEFDSLSSQLSGIDIIITSIDSPKYVLTYDCIQKSMRARGNNPLFVIDLGVPRNIEPSVNTIDNVFLHNIDALNHIVDSNLARRSAEIPRVQRIILDGLKQFKSWYDSLQLTPTIQQLQDQSEEIRKSEVERYRHRFNDAEQEEIEILTKRIVNKILHTPIVNLKQGQHDGGDEERRNRINLIRHLFGLDKRTKTK